MTSRAKKIEKATLPDRFSIGDKWQVNKQGNKYYVLNIQEGGPDGTLSIHLAHYLEALYSAQQHDKDRWMSMKEITIHIHGQEYTDWENNTHNQHLSYLRKAFSKELIKNLSKGKSPGGISRYRLTEEINPIEEEPLTEEPIEQPEQSTSLTFAQSTKWLLAIACLIILITVYIFAKENKNTPIRPITYDLSLRYSTGDDDKEYVLESGQVLHNDDRLRISLRPNEAAYVYLFYLDSSKIAHRLFPPAQRDGLPGNYQNPVDALYSLHLPSQESAYRLDSHTGYESLTIIVTDQALAQLETIDNPTSSEALSRLDKNNLEKTLTGLRHQLVKKCPTCIKTIDIIHR